jgi:hypothetical protein
MGVSGNDNQPMGQQVVHEMAVEVRLDELQKDDDRSRGEQVGEGTIGPTSAAIAPNLALDLLAQLLTILLGFEMSSEEERACGSQERERERERQRDREREGERVSDPLISASAMKCLAKNITSVF